MAELVGGAVLGAVFGESLKSALDFTDGGIKFDDNHEGFKSRVNAREQILREIVELDKKLGLPEGETKMFNDMLEEDEKLLHKCSKTQRWNFIKKASNSKKIKELEESKVRYFQIYGQLVQIRDQRKNSVEVRELNEKMKGGPVCGPNVLVGSCRAPEVPESTVGLDEKMEGGPVCSQNEFVGSCGVPEVPDSTVGLDERTKGGPVCGPNVALWGVLGAAFGELRKAVLDVKDKSINFKSNLDRLESRLNSVLPIVIEIGKLDKELGIPVEESKMFTDRLIESAKLVRKCSKTQGWNFFKKASYSKKLIEMEDLLVKFFQTDVQALMTRDSKKILMMVNEIDRKLDRMSSSTRKGGRVSDHNVFVGCCSAPRVPDFIVGLDVPLQELKMKLLKDGEQAVVLSAPGGYGKTTLAKMLCHDVEIEGKFQDNIFFVTVSKTPNLKIIIQNMFQHKNFQVPEFLNEDDAINNLGNLLSQNQIGTSPTLLVLDDVWSGSESLIQKFMFPIPEYKILVTSRFGFPGFYSTYKLEPLNDQDAMALFRNSAFPQGGSSNIPDDLVNEMVRGCRGLPPALTALGESLCEQAEVIWRHALKQGCEGQSIFDSNSDVLIGRQTSIDVLLKKQMSRSVSWT